MMSTPPPRTPPRFVPTLTDVVAEGGLSSELPAVPSERAIPKPASSAALPSAAPALKQAPPVPPQAALTPMAARSVPGVSRATTPPVMARPSVGVPSVPTVRPAAAPRVAVQPQPQPRTVPDGFEEMMVHRVMQRVDVMLETRLRDAIATVVQEQTRSILPRLREEVESVVRQSVYEAVADELASAPTAA